MTTMSWPEEGWSGPGSSRPLWREALLRAGRVLGWPRARQAGRYPAAASLAARSVRIARQGDGRWRVEAGCDPATPQFALLSEAVAFARVACGAAPATVELRIDGIVVIVHQEAGWPRAICREAGGATRPIPPALPPHPAGRLPAPAARERE